MSTIRRLLIANRGEIACRIIRTAKRLGITTVAIYSDFDKNALHVRLADQAVCVGPAPASESYLDIEAVINAAEKTRVDAIHPGYGFLSENEKFARATENAGLMFVGPSPSAISVMGSKSRSKALMKKAEVPLVPGYHGTKQDMKILSAEAEKAGFPILVKASAGGGGKGMRVVNEASELAGAVAGAKREAKASFGDDRMMIEKYLPCARHIEIQIFGDKHGNYVHLFERDCSLQRRHQKVIEEAPAPGMTEDLRARMGEAAVNAARAVDYVGAGTVEFLVAGDQFYFIEMNTRLQVEHPVTEKITGLDLVEWQLCVASGGELPLTQDEISINGHAFEARIYAENPDKNFLPQAGFIALAKFPSVENARVDSGVETGTEVGVNYDPMIAKLIVHAEHRSAALDAMSRALDETCIVGIETNIDFLHGILEQKAFRRGRIDTGWLDRIKMPKRGWSRAIEPTREMIVSVAMRVVAERRSAAASRVAGSKDPFSPWARVDGWRINDRGFQEVQLGVEDTVFNVRVSGPDNGKYVVSIDDAAATVSVDETRDAIVIDGVSRRMDVILNADEDYIVFSESGRAKLSLKDYTLETSNEDSASGGLSAPMPGRITTVLVEQGEKVSRGQALLVLEAMKMEHTISAPCDGEITEVCFRAGDQVDDGASLLIFESAS